MSENATEPKPVAATSDPGASYAAKREADFARLTAAQRAYSAVRSEVFPGIEPFIDRLGNEDEEDSSDESGEMIETALELAAEPWSNDELRLRAIVFLTRSAIKIRAANVEQMNREDQLEYQREREESKGSGSRRR